MKKVKFIAVLTAGIFIGAQGLTDVGNAQRNDMSESSPTLPQSSAYRSLHRNQRSQCGEDRHHEQHRVYLALGWTNGDLGSCCRDGAGGFWHPWVEHFLVGCVLHLWLSWTRWDFAMQGTSPVMHSNHHRADRCRV